MDATTIMIGPYIVAREHAYTLCPYRCERMVHIHAVPREEYGSETAAALAWTQCAWYEGLGNTGVFVRDHWLPGG